MGESGQLHVLRLGAASHRLGAGIDPHTPLAVGQGRVVARMRDGRFWVAEAGSARVVTDVRLSAAAGFVVLPLGVIAVEAAAGQARLVRLEPDAPGRWRVTARGHEAVLPDAQPIQVELDGGSDAGQIAVLAGPDASRYTHGVLGDAIEATRVLYLERHELSPLRELTLPAPHVFEDNRLRVWRQQTPTGVQQLGAVPAPDGRLCLVGVAPFVV